MALVVLVLVSNRPIQIIRERGHHHHAHHGLADHGSDVFAASTHHSPDPVQDSGPSVDLEELVPKHLQVKLENEKRS